jgi:hypothetical protein
MQMGRREIESGGFFVDVNAMPVTIAGRLAPPNSK